MQLKRVEIQGFKSFADKTNIEFLDGITAIVGPNGSGKSNVSDAIRWVLGEQSAKSLRGAKMEDVIFAGTEQRKMLGLAEVTLVLDNNDSKLPVEYNEVAVTRRVYRSGDSEYYINKNQCRLKDIQELFMDTGVGRDGYSIIGQGKIDEILSSKSEDRRSIFEEASGIVKYRTRKEEALRKLEHTNANLIRVTDVLNEIESSLGPLEEKSKIAKKYLELRDELKGLEVRSFINTISGTEEEINKINEILYGLEQSVLNYQKDIETIEKNKDEAKITLEKILLDIEKSQEEYFQKINELEKLKSRIETFDDRVNSNKETIEKLNLEIEENVISIESLKEDIEKRNVKKKNMLDNKVRFEQELEEKELELKELTQNMTARELEIEEIKRYIESLKDKITEYKVETSSLESTMEANQKRIDTLLKENIANISSADSVRISETEEKERFAKIKKEKYELEESIKNLEEVKNRIEINITGFNEKDSEFKQKILEIKSKINYLTNLENENEGYIRSVKEVIGKAKNDGIYGKNVYGTLASLVSTDEKYERAIEIALGGYIQNIVVENDKDAKDAIYYLKKNSLGRATFLPIKSIKNVKIENFKTKENGYVGLALDLVKYDKRFDSVVKLALGRTIIVDNIDNGVLISKNIPSGMKVVTLDGDIVMSTGSMTGGATVSKKSSLLGRSSKIDNAKQELLNIEKEYNTFNESIKNDKDSYQNVVNEINEKQESLNRINIDYSVIQEKLKNILKQSEKIANMRKNKEEEKDMLFKQNEDIIEKKLSIAEASAIILKEIEVKSQEIEEYARFNKEKEDNINFLNEDIVNLKISLSSFDESNLAIDEIVDKIKEDIESLELSIEKKKQSIFECENDLLISEQENKTDTLNIAKLTDEIEVLKRHNNNLKDSKNKNIELQASLEEQYIIKLQDLDKLRDQKGKVENRRTKFDIEIDSLKNKMWDDYELTISSAKEYDKISGIDNELSKTKLDNKINKTKNDIKALGEVSVSSIDEYKEQSERALFISTQKKDLQDTAQKLENLIDNTTSIMKTQFAKQFKIIRENFAKVFVELFDGGKADLRLSDENNILESGIEIEVQPPGKKLQNMMLLSGGERALTAIALLFAILKIKTPPFCILDEIEAALDDINVSRFAKYIKKYSKQTQFIVITHRKGTMEVASSVYGVTMQEYGVSKLVSMKLK